MASELKLRRQALQIFRASSQAADPVDSVVRTLRKQKYDTLPQHLCDRRGQGRGLHGTGRRARPGTPHHSAASSTSRTATWRNSAASNCTSAAIPSPTSAAWKARAASPKSPPQAGENDLVLCLISGGGSALMPLPAPPVTLADKQATTRLLLACGADIHEINAVRKHNSLIKGGQLARLAYPATVHSLMLSDVIGDDLDVIGSGPTAPDASTFGRVQEIFDKYELWDRLPDSVRPPHGGRPGGRDSGDAEARRSRLRTGPATPSSAATTWRSAPPPPKPAQLGFRTMVLSTFVEGETREVARMHAAIAKEIVHQGRPAASAGLYHHGRRDYGHDSGQRPGRPQPGVRAGSRDRYRRPARRGDPERRHRWQRRSHRCGGRDRRRPIRSRAWTRRASSWPTTIPITTSSSWAT